MGAENINENDNTTVDSINNTDADTTDSNNETVDVEAFAELISEKDKKLEQLETELKQLKKNNADLLVKITAQDKPKQNVDEAILNFCDTRKIK